MGEKTCSKLVVVVLLLCTIIYSSESALHTPLSLTGRRMMAYDPSGGIKAAFSESKSGVKKGERLMTYKPNGSIYTGPSNSGHGGGHINLASP